MFALVMRVCVCDTLEEEVRVTPSDPVAILLMSIYNFLDKI